MNERLYIPILLGTVREGRESEAVAHYMFEQLTQRPELEVELFDPRNFNLPMDAEGTALRDQNPVWRDAVKRADALVIVMPEYNHGYPGSLKRALDVLDAEYVHKAVGVVGVSSGWVGGVRVIEQLMPVLRYLGLSPIQMDLSFPKAATFFDAQGQPTDPSVESRVGKFGDQLVWQARSLRWGREHL